MIKNYIDNNAIEVRQEGQYIYYKFLAETEDEWKVLLDCSTLFISNEKVAELKQIEMFNEDGAIKWQYKGELRKHTLLNAKETKGEKGDVFIPSVSKDGILSWSNNSNLENPEPVNVKGEAHLPDNIVVNTITLQPDDKASVSASLSADKQTMTFNFSVPRGKNGTVRMTNYSDLKTDSKDIIGAINELFDKINDLETIINELKKD
jgi:hypothetical protein